VADIVYEIGAKDKATPALNTVDKGMSRLEASTKSLGEAAERSLGKVSISIGSLLKGAGVMAAVDLAVKGLTSAFGSVVGSISSANAAYDTQVEAVQGLETALRLNGEAVESESARLQTFASEMQAFSGVGDEVTLGLMRQAAMLGVSADQLDDTAAAAIGLSEATGKSLDESLKLVKNSLEGEFGAFGEIIPAIKTATSDTEKLAMVQELAAKGLDAKVEASNRLVGAEERAAGAVGDMMEQVGALLAPLRLVAAQGIQFLAEKINSLLVPAVAWVQSAFESMQPIFTALTVVVGVFADVMAVYFEYITNVVGAFIASFGGSADTFKTIGDFITNAAVSIGNTVIGAITGMEVILMNFGDVWSLIRDTIVLRAESIAANLGHLFGTVIPEYGMWLVENFPLFFFDAFNAISAIIENGATRVAKGFDALWEFIKSRGKGGLSGLSSSMSEAMSGSLLDGFESSVAALPQIAARAMTATEKELTASISETADKLASEYDAKMAKRTIKIGGKIGEDMAKNIDFVLVKKQEELEKIDAAKPDTALDQLLGGAGGGSALAALSAQESRLLTRGRVERVDPLVQIASGIASVAASTQKTAEAAALAASELEQIKINTANALLMVGIP
jgi:hypothetical protein